MELRMLFVRLLCVWWRYTDVYGNTVASNVFVKTVSPLKSSLDASIIKTSHAESRIECANMCRLNGCGAFTFMEEGHFDRPCYNTQSHKDYTGTWSTGYTGRTCQRWDSQSPHTHSTTDVANFPDATLAAAANYCRNPGAEDHIWCYTTDPNVRSESCDIHRCMDSIDNCRMYRPNQIPPELDSPGFTYFTVAGIFDNLCYNHSSHKDYTGTWNLSFTGRICQRWDSQVPHGHSRNHPTLFPDATLNDAENFCRDPDNSGYLWCYTNDPYKRFESCKIFKCINITCK